MTAPRCKNKILHKFNQAGSLAFSEIQSEKSILSIVDELEEDQYIKVTRDQNNIPILLELTRKGQILVNNGGYPSYFTKAVKAIISFVGNLLLKLVGAGIILLSFYI